MTELNVEIFVEEKIVTIDVSVPNAIHMKETKSKGRLVSPTTNHYWIWKRGIMLKVASHCMIFCIAEEYPTAT
jgi:hypothetical protein